MSLSQTGTVILLLLPIITREPEEIGTLEFADLPTTSMLVLAETAIPERFDPSP